MRAINALCHHGSQVSEKLRDISEKQNNNKNMIEPIKLSEVKNKNIFMLYTLNLYRGMSIISQ